MASISSRTLGELVAYVNKWCASHKVSPANGQSADKLTARTVRYYRTLGVVSAPISGSGHGFGEFHLLQLLAIRLLQAQGLPLQRIQTLLYGRSKQDLQKVVEKGVGASPPTKPFYGLAAEEDWKVVPVDETAWLVLRRGRRLSPEQIARIGAVIQSFSNEEHKATA
jgi:DNA-binding transcriptional MerR regulator